MKKDEQEKIYLIVWFFSTCLTMLCAYVCFYSLILPLVISHFCAVKVIFRYDDDDRGGNRDPDPDNDPDLELPEPDDGLSIKRLGDININSTKKPNKYDFSNN